MQIRLGATLGSWLAPESSMCYKSYMDTTIRNLDEAAYRSLKARAVLAGVTIGEMLNEAIRSYLARPDLLPRHGSLRDLKPEPYSEGSERLSEEVDAVVYGG
jgi:hypothetical protein